VNTVALRKQLPHLVSNLTKYFEIEAQTIQELKAAVWGNSYIERPSLRPIRQKPILCLPDDNAIVLDPLFHIEKAMVGPLFMLTRQVKDLLVHFGDAFERYAQNILRIMYPKDLLVGDDLKIMTREGEIEIADACLINAEKLLLFEMKAVWVRDDKVSDPDPEEYFNELRQKYGKDGKAADQMARAVNRLITGQWIINGHNIQDIRRIYPVLIAYDPLLNTRGHSWFFRSDFRHALEPDGILADSKITMVKGQWEVAPPTIVTIDILEDLEASVKNFDLVDLLEDYYLYCDANFRDADDDLSLPEFIGRSLYASKMDSRGSVRLKSLGLFKESMRMIDPENSQADFFRKDASTI